MTDVHQLPAPSNEYLDPDDVGLHNSPPLKPLKVNLQPSPSPPPAVPLPQVSPDSSPGPPDRKGSNRTKYRPSQGDAVLVSFMAGGKHSDIARDAGDKPLASDNEEEEPLKGTEVEIMVEKDEANPEKNGIELAALAVDRLRQAAKDPSDPAAKDPTPASTIPKLGIPSAGEPMEGMKPTIPSITTLYVDGSGSKSAPDTAIKHEMSGSPAAGELPPIRQHSPKSALSNGNGTGHITLPSISDQLGDINHLTEAAAVGDSAFSQSPPARPPPRFSAVPGHGSPPKSPNDAFRRELPSPGRGHFYFNASNHRRPSQTDGPQYSNAGDYSSSNTETPSTDQSGSTPATMAIDRMSIDGITNPQIGGFQCTYPGCTAQPFQTQVRQLSWYLYSPNLKAYTLQYLLNSHANVHSSNRPHYCSVKGCPRSEGGKGFKRKNEMIRHGLVHDSPGYVCPFCPDREHKYPRPDNLQRYAFRLISSPC